MVTKDFINIISLLLATALVVRKAKAQCTTNECTVCTGTDLVCEGLNNVPPLDTLDALSTDEQLISLRNGAINEIPAGYFNLSNVVSIDLSNNQLTTLHVNSFEFARNLQTIDLTGNPIVCDSNIDWLQKWKRFYPANTVVGTCTGSGETIEAFLSDKPGSLVDIRFAAASFVFDRLCHEIAVPFIVIGKFTSNLEYKAYIEITSSTVDISVANEYITLPVGTNTSEIDIDITNRGENRNDFQTLLNIIPKYPVSYERNAVIQLQNGAAGCEAPPPLITRTTPMPSVSHATSESVTSKSGGDTSDIPEPPPPPLAIISATGIIFTVLIICVALFVVRYRRKLHGKDSSSKRVEVNYENPGVPNDQEGYSELEKVLNDKQSQSYEELNPKQRTSGEDTFYDPVISPNTESRSMKIVSEYEEVPMTTGLVSCNETWEFKSKSTKNDFDYEVPDNINLDSGAYVNIHT